MFFAPCDFYEEHGGSHQQREEVAAVTLTKGSRREPVLDFCLGWWAIVGPRDTLSRNQCLKKARYL